MFDPNNTQAPGQMQTMNALAPHQQSKGNGWHQDFRNALLGWQGDRPMFDSATMQRGDFRQQMMDWRGLRPDRHDFRLGQQPGVPVGGMPQAVNAPLPQAVQQHPGMVGQSYGVQGMTPATSPYGLPTY